MRTGINQLNGNDGTLANRLRHVLSQLQLDKDFTRFDGFVVQQLHCRQSFLSQRTIRTLLAR